MSGTDVPARTVVVESPSSRRETVLVARAVFQICFWSAVVIVLERAAGSAGAGVDRATAPAPAAPTIPGELPAPDLDAPDRSLFRVLHATAAAIEKERGKTGVWPSAEALPPPADRGYRWKVVREGVVIDYLAAADPGSGRSSFLIVFVEPEPGMPSDPRAVDDEIHRRLPDGTMLHVTIWRAPDDRDVTRALAAPRPEDGWRRITGSPS